MIDNDPFWTPPVLENCGSQEELFRLLEANDLLENVWYLPAILTKEEGRRTRIRGKTFRRCRFSQTRFEDIIFRNCTFEHCWLIGSEFHDCAFHSCTFIRTNTYKIAIEKTYIDPLSFSSCLDKRKHQNIGSHLFRELLRNSRDEGQPEFERDAKFLFWRWKRYQHWYEIKQKLKGVVDRRALNISLLCEVLKGTWSYCWRLFWEVVSGSGIKIGRFALSATVTAAVFSTVNYICRDELGLERAGSPTIGYSDTLYFTIISLTTLGYGDITPSTTAGQLWASIQSIVGFILFAMLASMLFRRFFP